MPDITPFTEDDDNESLPTAGEIKLLRDELEERCKKAGFETEDVADFITDEPRQCFKTTDWPNN